MRHRISAGFMRNPHQMLRDQRAGDGCAQQIQPFIQGIGAEHRKDEITHEFFAHIDDVDVFRLDPHQDRLLARRFQLFALTEVSGERHHLAAVFGLQPFQDDRGVEPARIGQNDFLGLEGGHRGAPTAKTVRGLVSFCQGNKNHRQPSAGAGAQSLPKAAKG